MISSFSWITKDIYLSIYLSVCLCLLSFSNTNLHPTPKGLIILSANSKPFWLIQRPHRSRTKSYANASYKFCNCTEMDHILCPDTIHRKFRIWRKTFHFHFPLYKCLVHCHKPVNTVCKNVSLALLLLKYMLQCTVYVLEQWRLR